MKKFEFGLDNVLSYKQQVLEGVQNEYAQHMQRVHQQENLIAEIQRRYNALNKQFRDEASLGLTIAQASSYELGLRTLERQTEKETKKLIHYQEEAEIKRQEMIEARRGSVSLEYLKENKLEIHRKEMQKEQEKLIDEIFSGKKRVEIGS